MYREPEDKNKKEQYVGFPMKMNAYAHEGLFIMRKDENAFILYFLLGKQSQNYWNWGSVETTVVTLSKQFPIKTKEHDNKKEIRRLLLMLHDKGWIKITFDEESFEYDTLLTISMVDLDSEYVMEVVHSDNYKHTGWLKVTQEMFDACEGNSRYLRAMIYAEWRMFRGQENEGTYCISLDEWEKTMDVSHATAVKLVKELDELNLVDKQVGAMYTDANGQPRRETNVYSVVAKEERQEREAEAKEGQYSFAHQQNIDVNAMISMMDGIDPRTEGTNAHKTGKTDWLCGKCWLIWQTTEYKGTKEHLERRFEEFKKANPARYKIVESEGKALVKKRERDENSKSIAQARSDYARSRHMLPVNPIFDKEYYDNDEVRVKREARKAKEAEREAELELFYESLDYVEDKNEEEWLPF